MEHIELPWPTGVWRNELAQCLSSLDDLLDGLGLTRNDVGLGPDAETAEQIFRLRVPRGFASRIRAGMPSDPILLQILPTDSEVLEIPGFGPDPVGEQAMISGGGVVHKYRGRALVVLTGVCAIHCRYCFRRHFPYERAGDISQAVASVAADPSISEVILSGGDPLLVSDSRLGKMLADIESIRHVRRIRIHTRLPVVLPQRVDNGLVEVLSATKLPLVVVIHANHAQELSEEVKIACGALAAVGITLLNQTVLLAGINDDVGSLTDLSERLFDFGVLPYYLHLLDPVAGAAHFDVAEAKARKLMAEVAAQLPGYLVPRLVRDVEGAPAKVVLIPESRATFS